MDDNINLILHYISKSKLKSSHIIDIQVVGSRCYGFYRESSDFEIIILGINDDINRQRRSINERFYHNDIKYVLRHSDIKILNRKWGEYLLPRKSLITGDFINVDKEMILKYIKDRIKRDKTWLEGRKLHHTEILSEKDIESIL